MSNPIQQSLVMIRANLGSLRRRLWISLSMILSIALVVAVLIGFLAMARGFETTLSSAGSSSVAIVLGGGSNIETGSEISAEDISNLRATRDRTGVVRQADGNMMLSRELLLPVDVRGDQTLSLRGMDPEGQSLRQTSALSSGRLFTPGSREIVVGETIAREFPGFGLGEKIRLGTVDWTVTGHFSAGGSAFESEIWADLDAVQSAFSRQSEVQTLRLRLDKPEAITTLQATLDRTAKTPLRAISEAEFYAAQAEGTSRLIRLFGWPIALLMAIGATAGALNTIMSSVSDRAMEIATVRVIGFSRFSAFTATWVEALILSLIGAAIGTAASWLIFNGWQASTLGANQTRLAFQLSVTPGLMLQAASLAMCIGVFGGAVPAYTAARLPLLSTLNGRR
jgi:putative ABC transport system permease protein